jgi:prevent-host-death family protein
MQIGTFEAKTRFSQIIEEVQKGENYIITKRGKPVAKIVPFSEEKPLRKDIVNKLCSFQEPSRGSFDILAAVREGRK